MSGKLHLLLKIKFRSQGSVEGHVYFKLYCKRFCPKLLNPSKLVGNEELGEDWCEVKVTLPIKYDHGLIRKIGSVKVIGQAIGTSITWPKFLVEVEDAIKKA